MKLQVLAWSPSRYAKYKECPAKVKYEDLMKMCPICFKGRIKGGFDGEPVVCDTCSDPQPAREALDRGNRLDAALTLHVAQPTSVAETPDKLAGAALPTHPEDLAEALRHPALQALAKQLRRAKNVLTQARLVFDKNWNRLEEDPSRNIWARGAWGRLVLDVLHLTPRVAKVIDWKSGNIDKKTGDIRERPEYHDSMRVYQIVALSAYPQGEASATMAFLDCPPKVENPFKSLPVLKRKELESAKEDWERKITPMMNDTIFAPRPGFYCQWCSFGKSKGGPCALG